MEIIETFKNKISDNVCGLINSGEITTKSINKLEKILKSEISQKTKDYTEQQINENINQVKTASDITGTASTFLYNKIIVKSYNEGITRDLSDLFSNNNSDTNNDINLEKEIEDILVVKEEPNDDLNNNSNEESNKDLQSDSENEQGEALEVDTNDNSKDNHKENKVFNKEYEEFFTEEEKDRILGRGDFAGKDMFDYSLKAGATDRELKIDNDILSILINKDVKGFEKFKIIDKAGNRLKAEHYNTPILGFLKIFCKDCINGSETNFKIADASKKVLNAQKKLLKAHHSKGLKNLCMKGLGADELRKQFKDVKESLNPTLKAVKIAKTAENIAETSVKTTYKTGKAVAKLIAPKADFTKLTKFENIINIVRHPVKNVKEAVVRKTSKLIGNPLSKIKSGIKRKVKDTSKKALRKIFGKRISHAASVAFSVFGKMTDTIKIFTARIIFVIKKSLAILLFPFILLLIITLIIAAISSSTINVSSAPIILPIGNLTDFEIWQNKYNELEDNFLEKLEDITYSNAEGSNLKGEKIKYGVNGLNNEENMKNDDYVNGLFYKFTTDENHDGKTSNIEDLISIMAIMLSQNQSSYIDTSLKVFEWLYNLSHIYIFQESNLYACDSGCHEIEYECNDHFHEYSDTDIKYNPFHAASISGDDYEIEVAENYCVVCDQHFNGVLSNPSCYIAIKQNPTKEDYYGCVSHSNCFHGSNGNMGTHHNNCDNYEAVYKCPGHTHGSGEDKYTTYCDSELGCKGYYKCNGHSHYSCDKHIYKCCMGHRNLQLNILVKFADEIKETIDNIDFGENDTLANLKKTYKNYQDYINDDPYVKSEE